jgi:type I restriction enzyme R subunit
MLTNASYFAFTATPKGKTIEMFGVPVEDGKHKPYDNYSMKQAIQEGFILDVLKYFTPIKSYYKLIKTVTDNPEYDKKKARKKLRKFVESDKFAIATKANIMVEHFHTNVAHKIGGKARSMVATGGIDRAIEYYYAICSCLEARKSSYKAIIAFSGEKEYNGEMLTESKINGFPSNDIEDIFVDEKESYRFLVVADKFQTGYDEPLLHTMYVDKVLSDIKAVQTLSRLNRAAEGKIDTFVLDFANEADDIAEAFSRYYRTTILSGETDPNKLYDIIATMERHEVYTQYHVDSFIELYLNNAERNKLEPLLNVCVSNYKQLDEDGQVEFKSSAKAFVRTYGFLGAILPYGSPEWEKLSIFLNLLLLKLPSPREEDLSAGILEAIDLDSYRTEAKVMIAIQLEDKDSEVEPAPTDGAGGKGSPELDLLSNILSTFNDIFGNIEWKDADNVRAQIQRIPGMVARDEKYQNAMKNSDKQNARMESDAALQRVIFDIMADNMEIFKQWGDNPSFKKWLADMVFSVTYNQDNKM